MTGTAGRLRCNHPADPGRGFIVILPGGGYRIRAAHEAGPPLAWLARIGWRAGVLNYTVGPARYPAVLVELVEAIARVRAGDYGPMDGPVGVLGFSAGGHLAGLAATATEAELFLGGSCLGAAAGRPDFAVLAYPVVSMVDHPHLGSRASLLPNAGDDESARLLSVEERADPHTPPMFLWTTAMDRSVSPRHSLRLADRLIGLGVSNELHVYPDGSHGLGMADGIPVVDQWPLAAGAWLARLRQDWP